MQLDEFELDKVYVAIEGANGGSDRVKTEAFIIGSVAVHLGYYDNQGKWIVAHAHNGLKMAGPYLLFTDALKFASKISKLYHEDIDKINKTNTKDFPELSKACKDETEYLLVLLHS